MGRTVPSFRTALEHEIHSWKPFKRAIRGEEKEIFDKMMNHARNHATAGMNAARFDVLEAVFMSIILEQQKEIEDLKRLVGSTN